MARVGIYRISFAEQNETDDVWVEQQPQQLRGGLVSMILRRWFNGIDQRVSTLEENIIDDEGGIRYETTLSFTVRKDADIALAKKYSARPVVIYADAVDGNTYIIGTKDYPARMSCSNRYDGLNTREVQVNVRYQSLSGALK